MAGYDGWSMSNNAREAYDRGSMPISKWTKKAILEQIAYDEIEVPSNFGKLPVKKMKEVALKSDGWHHTSKFYNVTNFYELDVDYLENLTEERVNEMIEDAKAKKVVATEIEEKEPKKKSYRSKQTYFDNGCEVYRLESEGQAVEFELPESGRHTVYLADEETEIPDHYFQIAEFKGSMEVKAVEFAGGEYETIAKFEGETIRVFRAGDFGWIIQSINK